MKPTKQFLRISLLFRGSKIMHKNGKIKLRILKRFSNKNLKKKIHFFYAAVCEKSEMIYLTAGGCYVEGNYLRNAFRWKETVGPWEQRPGHFGDVWGYWSDDGLGYLEYLQVINSNFIV